jgi:hypothetical protein
MRGTGTITYSLGGVVYNMAISKEGTGFDTFMLTLSRGHHILGSPKSLNYQQLIHRLRMDLAKILENGGDVHPDR